MSLQKKIYHGYDDLKTVNNIEFTEREIDVIACMLNGKPEKRAIASFLTTPSRTISVRTVETHLRNVTRKLGCANQKGIIDFIEKSHTRPFVREHYEYLQSQINFEKQLATFRTHLSHKPWCMLYGHSANDEQILTLLNDFAIAGIKTITQENEMIAPVGAHRLYVVSQNLINQFEADKEDKKLAISQNIQKSNGHSLTFLVLDRAISNVPKEFSQIGVVDINDCEDYQVLVFRLLQRIVTDPGLGNLLDTMIIKRQQTAFKALESFIKDRAVKRSTIITALKSGTRWVIPVITVSAATLYLLDWVYKSNTIDNVPSKEMSYHSTNLVFLKDILLQRPHLVKRLQEKLKGTGGIQAVALIGIGGAGKTILARQYAQQQEAVFIWEINAETLLSIMHSFEKMATALCQKEEDHKLLRSLQSIQNLKERTDKILNFVQGKLKARSKWFLLYDNVQKIAEIRPYLPLEMHTWGNGKVIITTRNSHTQQDHYIDNISVGPLTAEEKLVIFMNIMHWCKQNGSASVKLEDTKNFLKKIAPFPLDVSLAAYYLKATKLSYVQYLDHLAHYKPGFIMLQERVLKDASNYTCTRYSIIGLSIDRLLATSKDFEELMLLISAVDSQNIPKELLTQLKDKLVVDDFIYHLKQYSLVVGESVTNISLHRSTQEISLQYLTQKLNLYKNTQYIQNIAVAVGKYVDNLLLAENFTQLRHIITHLEVMLTKDALLLPRTKINIGINLGNIYLLLNYYTESRQLLESILKNLDNSSTKDFRNVADAAINLGSCYVELGLYKEAKHLLEQGLVLHKKHSYQNLNTAKALYYLGELYRELGDYKAAKAFLIESCTVYEKLSFKNSSGFALSLALLGVMCRELGDYEQARDYLETSIRIYKQLPDKDEQIHHALGSLGVVYGELGDYAKAKDLLVQNIQFFKQRFSDNLGHTMHAESRLGNVYKNLGDYETARKLLENNINMLRKYFPDRLNSIGRSLAYLGDVHRCSGNLEEALTLVKEALHIHEQHYGRDNLETARVLQITAKVCFAREELEIAEAYLIEALKIFQKSAHPGLYAVFEDLAELYVKKSAGKQARDYLLQAKHIVKTHFPGNSPHLQRIEIKLEAMG